MEAVKEMSEEWAAIVAMLLNGYGVTAAGVCVKSIHAACYAILDLEPDRRDWTPDDVKKAYAKLERVEAKAKERGLL